MAVPILLMPACMQLASLFFLGAALFGDMLLIRLCLSVAFFMLLLQSALSYVVDRVFLADAVAWALVTGSLHVLAAYRLARESRANRFRGRDAFRGGEPDGDDAALERFLVRRTGAGPADVARLRRRGAWVRFRAGDRVCGTEASRERFYVVVEGVARIVWRNEGVDAPEQSAHLASGDAFDLRLLNLAGVFVGFPNERFEATAATDALCFAVSTADLVDLVATHSQFSNFLTVLALDQLARALAKATDTAPGGPAPPRDSYGEREDGAWFSGARSRDFAAPYDDLESKALEPPPFATWIRDSVSPTVQPGCRNTFFPFSGRLAQAHVAERTTSGLLTAKQEASTRLLDAPSTRGGAFSPKKRPSASSAARLADLGDDTL